MARYETTLQDSELMEYATIKSNDPFLFAQKQEKQLAKWQKERTRINQENMASNLIKKAINEQNEYQNILNKTLSVDDKINWENLKDQQKYEDFIILRPDDKDIFYKNVPQKSFFETFLPFLTTRRERMSAEAEKKYNDYLLEFETLRLQRLDKYNEEKADFIKKQKDFNDNIENLKINFEMGKVAFVCKYIEMVLENSEYPQTISIDHEIEYDKQNLCLKIRTFLPDMNKLNFITDVKYLKSKNEVSKKTMPKKEMLTIYKSILNQIVLRTIHEIFESEYIGHIQEVQFEGVTRANDPRTGNVNDFQIIKLNVDRKKFTEINLSKVDHEACIESLGSNLDKKNIEQIFKSAA